MYSGFVMKRNSSTKAPPMKRVFCTLWGTLLLDFDTEEDAKSSLTPKCVLELIGVSKWDGQIGSTKYDHGLLVVSHIGTTYYMSVGSHEDKNEWITYIRSALECNFANTSIIEFRPSKASFEPASPVENLICPISGTKVTTSSGLITCTSCGQGVTAEHVNEVTPILQIGQENSLLKVCTHCSDAQACLLWLKKLLNIHALLLHERTPDVLVNINRYKASFKLRRKSSTRLDMAATLREQESVTDVEFEELRRVDYDYRQEHMLFEFNRMRDALEVLGDDMQSMLGFLSNPSGLSDTPRNGTLDGMNGSLNLYFLVVLRLVTLADVDPDLIDFYWPQIIHIHLLLSKSHQSPTSLGMVDLLQQGLLAIALKYPQLAVKLSWALLAAMGDYTNDKKITQTQYASCVCLLLQLEVHTYGVASCLTGIENSSSSSSISLSSSDELDPSFPAPTTSPNSQSKSILMNVLHPANHQKQELVIELYTLIRIRRKAHTVHNNEMAEARSIAHKHGEVEDDKEGEGGGNSISNGNSSQGGGIFSEKETTRQADGRLYCVDLFLDNFNDRNHHHDQQQPQPESDDIGAPSATSTSDTNNETTTEDSENITDTNVTGASEEGSNVGAKTNTQVIWQGLSDQLDWVESLTDLVDTLRFVDRPARADVLKNELNRLFCHPNGGELLSFALDPTSVAGEPMYRMKRLFVEETRVFRTKARAPSLLIFEVERAYDALTASSVGGSEENKSRSVSEDEYMNKSHRGGSFDHIHHGHVGVHHHGQARSRSHTMEDSMIEEEGEGRREDDEEVDVNKILNDKMQATISSIHKVEEERKTSDTTGGTVPMPRRSASDTDFTSRPDVAEDSSLTPTQPLHSRSHSAVDLAGPTSGGSGTGRSKRLSSTGNFNAITKVDFQDSAMSMSEEFTPPPPTTHIGASGKEDEEENEEDEFIHVPRISNDVPAEEIEISQKVIDSAVKLFNSGLISREEYHQLVDSNVKYRNEAKNSEEAIFQAKLEGYFGLDWELKKQKLLRLSDHEGQGGEDDVTSNNDDNGDKIKMGEDDTASVQQHHRKEWPERDLRCFIVKSNDDLRQEVACIQLIELCQEIFADCNLNDSLWLKPYRIVSTGPAAGFVETLPNTLSIDAIKKTANFVSLPLFFQSLYGSSSNRLEKAKKNFVKSLAAYSLVTYILSIKDRHNGNILIDQHGHVIHIDFGFLLGIAPGGSFSIESAPFKLTEEMLDVFGGIDSDLFSEFVKAFTQGFLALRSKSTAILSAVTLIANDSSFPCFQGKDPALIVDKLRQRFKCEMSSSDAIEHCLELIIQSYSNLGTRQYDSFQWYTNGIIP